MQAAQTYTHLPDADLVAFYKKEGSQHYLATLYQRYAGLLFGVCLKYLEDAEAAQDASADIYEELITKVARHDIDNFKGWLYMLAKNHCLQKIRSAKKMPFSTISEQFMQLEENWHLEDVLEKEANLQAMQKCLDGLATDQKTTVNLFYLEEKCYNQIAEITGLPWNAVRSHIQNGKRKLKICMEQHGNA